MYVCINKFIRDITAPSFTEEHAARHLIYFIYSSRAARIRPFATRFNTKTMPRVLKLH